MNAEIQKAVDFATECHRGQFRKKMVLPFIIHPLDVLREVMSYGVKDVDVLMATVCHDVLEDCKDVSIQKIEDTIGKRATEIVIGLTFSPVKNSIPFKIQKQQYLDDFDSPKPIECLVVKAADRICNVRDFKLTDKTYAPEYFHKADMLFMYMKRRDREINAKFGIGTSSVMRYSLNRITEELKCGC